MASPLDIIQKEKELYLPKTLELANSLFQAFIKNNNLIGLKIAIVLSGAKSQITYNKDNQVKLDVDKLCKLINCTRKELSLNLKKITDIFFKYVSEEGGRGGTHPIHSYQYTNNNKALILEVSSKAKSIFTELGKGHYAFSKANAYNLMGLKHKHSLRMQMLLELINNFDTAKRKRFTLEELNGYFGTNYKNYYELDRKILRPVKEEIDSNSSITFVYAFNDEVIGSGRPKIKEVVLDLIQKNTVQGKLL